MPVTTKEYKIGTSFDWEAKDWCDGQDILLGWMMLLVA
jgi:hypothetical protein